MPASIASGVLVTASGLVLTSRRAIAEAIDGRSALAMVRSTRGRLNGRDLATAVPARLIAVSDELDLALVEAMPAEAVFYPHLPIARQAATDGSAALAIGHAKKRGLWSATMIPLGGPAGDTGTARWMRKLPAETSLVAAGTPLVDAVGRIVGLVIEPTMNGWRMAVDTEGLLRFLLAANAPELRFAGVPPFRRPVPGQVEAVVPSDGRVSGGGVSEAMMPTIVKKGALDRRFVTPAPSVPTVVAATGSGGTSSGRAGRAAVSFTRSSGAVSITLANLERHPVPATVRVDTADAPERGSPTAPITIVQIGDYHAPETRDVEATIRRFVDGESTWARLLWKDGDRGDGEAYQLPARAARAAGEQQGFFWPMHDRLMRLPASSPEFDANRARKLARELGLDPQQFAAALSSDGLASAVEADAVRAGRLPLLCTPAFVINGRAVDGGSIASSALRAALEEELARADKQLGSAPDHPRTIAPGAPVTGASFDAEKIARAVAEATTNRRVAPVEGGGPPASPAASARAGVDVGVGVTDVTNRSPR